MCVVHGPVVVTVAVVALWQCDASVGCLQCSTYLADRAFNFLFILHKLFITGLLIIIMYALFMFSNMVF